MGARVLENETTRRNTPRGLVVVRVEPRSAAARAGVMAGDRIFRVNSQPVNDTLDLYAASFAPRLSLAIDRNGDAATAAFERAMGEDIGIEVRPERPSLCNNKCVFCFVDQMPRGLRRSLYVKDEDYRLSFLHGNYLTLTNISPRDEDRIKRMRLSPLYVSVHATQTEARARLLGRRPQEPVLAILDRLGQDGIRFHTQVVLVPGYNDGKVLERTLEDICERCNYVESLSVVPVGLTSHRKGLPYIEPVGREVAAGSIHLVGRIHERMRERLGRGMVYASDEMFLLAGEAIPDAAYYDAYPQLDNGVGLIRNLLESLRGLRVPARLKGKRMVFVTGILAAPYIEKAADLLGRRGMSVEVLAVENRLFGPSVTVSGLLSGRDILGALREIDAADAVVLPPNVLNPDGLTLDGLSLDEVTSSAGMPTLVGAYDFKETVKRIHDVCQA